MIRRPVEQSEAQKEYTADLLKERIYATLALLAVLISIDTEHYNARHSAFVISGTIISLWAASIVSSLMTRRVVYQDSLDHERERVDQLRKTRTNVGGFNFSAIHDHSSYARATIAPCCCQYIHMWLVGKIALIPRLSSSRSIDGLLLDFGRRGNVLLAVLGHASVPCTRGGTRSCDLHSQNNSLAANYHPKREL